MNKVAAVVKSIDDMEIITYITLEINNIEIKIIKPKAPQWLSAGDNVYFTFQELSVCIGRACNGKVSIGNRIPATLTQMRTNGLLYEVKFDSAIGEVVSLITQNAFDELQLDVDLNVTILLREIDINLEPYLEPMSLESFMNSRTKVAN